MRHPKQCFLVLLGGLLLAAGCSKAKPLQVLVTLDSKPLAGASVTLHSDAVKADAPFGMTGPDGVASLNTLKKMGVPPGTYKVIVSKSAAVSTPDPKDMEAMKKMMMAGPGKSELPEVYSDAKKTPLSLTVPPDSSPAKIELKSKP
jgi:hypothetical protein